MKPTIWAMMLLLVLLGSSQAMSQSPQRPSRYTPSRPTISPWLYLPRGGTGGLPSYYAWVRPQFDMQRREQFVDNEIRYVEGQMLRQPQKGTGSPSTAATYFNYGHFYPQSAGGSSQR